MRRLLSLDTSGSPLSLLAVETKRTLRWSTHTGPYGGVLYQSSATFKIFSVSIIRRPAEMVELLGKQEIVHAEAKNIYYFVRLRQNA